MTVPPQQSPHAAVSRALPAFLPGVSTSCPGPFPSSGCADHHPRAGRRFGKLRLTAVLLIFQQALQNRELSVAIGVPTLELGEDSPALLLPTVPPSRGPPAAEQTTPTVQLLLGENLSRDTSGYCANGFGPDRLEGRDPSCTHSQLGHALGSQLSSWLEEGGEACHGDGVLEQPVLMGLTRDSYTGDRDYRTSETWLSLHLQLYSECQCPALGASSCLPLATAGRSCSQQDLRQSPDMTGCCVLLSSVKLPASEEEDGGQLTRAFHPLHGHGTESQPGDSRVQRGELERAALTVPLPSPCQLPPDIPQAAAFSGYELRPPAASGL